MIKTDSNGDEQWNKTFGGANDDFCSSIQPTDDGGYIITGRTKSYGVGNSYAWLIRMNGIGNEQWNKTYGEKYYDHYGGLVEVTNDEGYIFTSQSIFLSTGITDFKLIKTDDRGHVEWMKILGGNGYDYGYEVHQTNDGGFVIVGWTDSFGAGSFDGWLVKVSSFDNQRPNKPRVPSGPIKGKAGNEFTYISSSADSDGDNIYYYFDWGDGSNSDWLGPYDSGDECSASHIWNEQDSYEIKVKVKDVHNGESDWSDPLPISMSKSKTTNRISFLDFIRSLTDRISLLENLLEFGLLKYKSMI